jgi:hypothetical protein
VPDRRSGDVVHEVRACERVVELARESIEDEAVAIGVVDELL